MNNLPFQNNYYSPRYASLDPVDLFKSKKKRQATLGNSSLIRKNSSFKGSDSKDYDSLDLFQRQLNYSIIRSKEKANMQLNNKKRKLKQLRTITQSNEQQLRTIKQQMNGIKHEIQFKKRQQELENKISQIVQKRNSQLVNQKPSTFLPYINSLPIPSPHYQQPPLYRNYGCNCEQSDEQYQQKKYKKKNLKEKRYPKKKMTKIQREQNRIRLRKICRKVFLAVTYTIFLKNLTKKLTKKRRQIFDSFWPQKFKSSSHQIGKWIFSSCRNFFEKMLKKEEVSMEIQGDQSEEEMQQKKKMIKTFVSLFRMSCNDLVESATFNEVCKIIHLFCKHGSDISKGVLTVQELETVCISEVNGYLRLDTPLEKSQIINFLFHKIMIYNLLLQPWKFDNKKFSIQHEQLYKNFYYFSSVFYQIMCEIQDELVSNTVHQESIEVGNWRKIPAKFKIKPAKSLCHLDNKNYEKGQIISGLVPEQSILTIFPSSTWDREKQLLIGIIDKMHSKMQEAHQLFINKEVYNYKKILDKSKFL